MEARLLKKCFALLVISIFLFLLLFLSGYMSSEIMSGQLYQWVSKEAATASMENVTPIPMLLKKNYTKMPHWDFEDVYVKDTQYRLTTCPHSLQQMEDPAFKKAFISNIQLFMNREHLNVKEWNRLAHFNNPFGFMETNYTEVKAVVNLIPRPREPLVLPRENTRGCVRCAVVGTGGILNGSGMGREIDSHDYVFRMNGAVIQGFEYDVGNKTSVYVHTAYSITTSPLLFKKYGFNHIPNDEGIKYVLIPEGQRDIQWLQGLYQGTEVSTGPFKDYRPRTYYNGRFDKRRFYVLHPDFLRYVRNRFLKSEQLNSTYWNIVRPSNGAFTLFLALQTCDEVDAYGFLTEDHMKYNNYYFEQNTKTKVIYYINHDYILEMNTWKKMHDSKVIKLYQR